MPREIAHFLAVDYVVENLPKLKTLMSAHKLGLESLYIGSITPDSPYYYPFGNSEEVAEFIHGKNGNDTFAILRTLVLPVENLTSDQNELRFLFSAGILTHIIMDAVMHPFINMLSGDYYSPDRKARKQARTLHRRLETDLDSLLLCSMTPKYISLLDLRTSLGEEMITFSRDIDAILGSYEHSSHYKAYFHSHALLHSLLNTKFAANISMLLPTEIQALCGFGRKPHELFSREVQYLSSEKLYYHHNGEDLDLLELYFLAQDFLLKEMQAFIDDPSKYLSLRGPSLVDGAV